MKGRREPTKVKVERAMKEAQLATAEGLRCCPRADAGFFKAIPLGVARITKYMSHDNTLYAEWWVPGHYYDLNETMRERRLSGKLRGKLLRLLQAGKPLPDRLALAMAQYVEDQLRNR